MSDGSEADIFKPDGPEQVDPPKTNAAAMTTTTITTSTGVELAQLPDLAHKAVGEIASTLGSKTLGI